MTEESREIKLFTLNANRPLAETIAKTVGVPLSNASIKHFADGEIQIDIDDSVRGSDVFVIQSTNAPVNENWMELFVMVDALRRASAKSINVVIPYYAYSRSDRKARSREPITAKLLADFIEMDGVNRVLAIDLHADQIQGFFDIPVDHFLAMPIQANFFAKKGLIGDDVVVIAPDHNSVKKARKLAELLKGSIAIVDKRPDGQTYLIGDVKHKRCIILDDMIDTGNRMAYASEILAKHDASEIYACATHAVLSKDAPERLKEAPIKKVVVTDTINIPENKRFNKLTILSVGELIGEAIKLVANEQSVDVLFNSQLDKSVRL